MERIWSVDISKDSSNLIAFGFDDGTVVVKIGSDEPVVSMKYIEYLYLVLVRLYSLRIWSSSPSI